MRTSPVPCLTNFGPRKAFDFLRRVAAQVKVVGFVGLPSRRGDSWFACQAKRCRNELCRNGQTRGIKESRMDVY